jgi:hypothetical protein
VSAARHYHQQRQPWDDRAPVQAQLRHIRDQAGSYRGTATAADLPAPAVQALMNSQEHIDPATTAALLAVTAEDLHTPRVPADSTRLQLRSLMAIGHGYTRLAHAAGTSPSDIRKTSRARPPR